MEHRRFSGQLLVEADRALHAYLFIMEKQDFELRRFQVAEWRRRKVSIWLQEHNLHRHLDLEST